MCAYIDRDKEKYIYMNDQKRGEAKTNNVATNMKDNENMVS